MYTILYVDDEPGLLEVGRLFLEQGGQFSVDTITSAEAALALLHEKTYDAIISDYQMPAMDGIEFLKKVRGLKNTIPFILFTGRGREEVVIQALNEGADFYLQKGGEPVAQFTELAHQIRQAVQQRRAEISIRDLERREADIINFLPDATFAIDRSGHIIAWNHAIEEMTGVPAAEMLGKGDYEYAIPFYGQRQQILIDLIFESDEIIARKYDHIVRTKDILIADTSLPRPKGKPLTLMGKASPLYNRQGEIIGAIESIRDITEMKKAEESLCESEGRFAAFMDHLPVTAFIKDDQSTNLFVNRQMVEIFGEHEWVGKPVYNQFSKEAADKMIEDDRQTIKDGYRKATEYLVEKNGSTRIFETHKFRIDRDNKPPLIGGFAIDITEQKRVEDAIRESEEKYRSTIEAFPDAVSVVDREFKVILANTNLLEWMRTLGFSDDIIGRPILDAFPFLGPAVLDEYRTVFSTGTTMITEESSKIGKGEIVTETRKIPLQEHGDVVAVVAIIRDVTERKRAEEALNESEMRFRKIFENSPLGMALSTPDFRFYSVNPAWVSMTGYAEEELLKMSFTDITHPEHLAGDVEHIRELAEGKIPVYSAEKRYIRKDKSILWGLIRVTAIRDQQGTVRYFAAQIEDITERKMAEEELRQSEDRYRNVVEDQTEFISRFLPDGTHIFVNKAYCRYFGLKREELLGHRFRPAIPAEDRERVKQFFASLTPDHPVNTIEHRIIMPDSSIRWQWWSDRAIFDPSGTLTEYQSVGQDITEWKLEDQALHESEQRLTSIYNTVGDSIFQLAIEPGEQYRFTFVNPAFCRTTGLPPERVIGRTVNEVIPEPSLFLVLEKYRQAVEEKTVVRWEETSPYPSGKLVGDVSISPIFDRDGTCTHLIGSVHDITERKRAEDIIRESEEQSRILIGHIQDGAFLMQGGVLLFCNKAFAAMIGYTPSEIIGMPVPDLIAPEDRDMVMERQRDRLAGRPLNESYEFSMLHRDATTRVRVILSVGIGTYKNRPAVIGTVRDMTKERERQLALSESEEKYRALVETSFDGILIHQDGAIVYANITAVRLFGAGSEDEILGRPVLSLVHPEFRTVVLQRMVSATEETQPSIREKFLRIDGSIFDADVVAIPFVWKNKPAVHVVFRDISERERVEEILRKSEAHLKRAEEVGRSGSWEFRLSENTVITSEGARALYGLEGIQWTIPEVQEIPLPEYRPVLNSAMRDLIAGKSPYDIEFKIRRQSDGAVLDIHSLAEYDAVHNVVFGVIHDVTGRKKAEEELIFKNLILSTQQETSLDGILIVDENGRILNYNRKFTEIWGIPESLIASRIDEPVLQFVVMQNADPEAFLSRVRYLYNHKEKKSFEELLLKDGRTLERFSAPILGEKGKYYGRVWYFRDITGRKKTEEVLREVNKKLNLLSKITRHDINNQLTLLQANLKILEMKKPDASSDPQFQKVATSAQRISSMIQFTREYEEIGVNAPAWQDCHALVDTAVKDVPLGTILVKNDLPSGTEVFADPLIVKVFYNLMDNAVRYGRKITTIRFSVQESGDKYLIVCEDDGDGIPADEKERIFERDFGKNTGLGLFLSREILGITGITISEMGVPGRGARFEILVPKSTERFTSAGQE